MTVIWERPAVDGGSDIDGYYLEKREIKSLQWFKVIKDQIRDTRQKVSHLTPGNEYQYRVCAINKAGAGAYSEVSTFYKAYDPIGKYQLLSNVLAYSVATVDTTCFRIC